ncbi:acetyl-CoA acetyltransferase, partial [Mycobacterium tuberculosis]
MRFAGRPPRFRPRASPLFPPPRALALGPPFGGSG